VVNVTSNLNEDEWAMVLDSCQEHGVHLIAHCAPDVVLPEPLQQRTSIVSAKPPRDVPALSSATRFIQSSDTDTTVALLTAKAQDSCVIDVCECRASDLLQTIHGKVNDDLSAYTFTVSTAAVLKALNEKKRVILKGQFSPELADELASFLLKRQQDVNAPGELILVGEDMSLFNYLPIEYQVAGTEQKRACLGNLSPKIEEQLKPFIEKEPLSRLVARRDFLRANAEASSEEAWQGMHHLSSVLELLPEFDVASSRALADACINERLTKVNRLLAQAPYVFLSGLSGVGKSTFVVKNLCQNGDKLYSGENNILEWAKDHTTTGRKILFIDEANLNPRQWSEFEGLFHNPPGILIKGNFYPLSPQHKVVFAGNPVTYGDERHLAPFFERHGNAVVFDPLPPAFIYEEILKPVFDTTSLANQAPVSTLSYPLILRKKWSLF
jgi:hypothetical protein